MKIAVLSDIHSNLEALKAVLADAGDWGASSCLVAGDIVGYGASPNQCISLVRDLDALVVAGNHDWGVVGKTPISYFNRSARQAVLWTRDHIDEEGKKYLASLPLTLKHSVVSIAHANFLAPQNWDYVLNIYQARRQFQGFSTRLGVIGHSHLPFVVRTSSENGWANQIDDTHSSYKKGERYLINSGSVGQPRDGNPKASYLRVDTSRKEFRLCRVSYDVVRAGERIIAARLPPNLAQRLSAGR